MVQIFGVINRSGGFIGVMFGIGGMCMRSMGRHGVVVRSGRSCAHLALRRRTWSL